MANARSNSRRAPRQIPKASEHEAEVASGAGERGIVRPVDRLADGHRPLQLATRTREIPKISEYPAEFVVPLADLRVVGWKRRLGDGQGAFGHRPGLPRLPSRPQVPRGPAEQPPGRLTGHPQPLGMLRRGRHMRQQPLNHWPACHSAGSLRKPASSRLIAASAQRRSSSPFSRALRTAWTSRCRLNASGVTTARE